MIDPVLITTGKVALLLFITGAVAVLIGTYIWRRCHGVRPWRPPNSRIIGYDAPIPQIEQPPRQVFTNGKLPLTVSPRRSHATQECGNVIPGNCAMPLQIALAGERLRPL